MPEDNSATQDGLTGTEGPIDYEWLRSQLHSLTVQEKDDWEDPSGGILGNLLESLESGLAPEANILDQIEEVQDYLNLPGPDGDTILHLACLYGHSNLVTVLLEKGADPALANSEDGSLPLHDACAGGYLEIVQQLVAKDREGVHAVDGDGETPLHCAARGGFADVVQFLLTQGADPRVENTSGHTPAQESDDADVKNLLGHGDGPGAADGVATT